MKILLSVVAVVLGMIVGSVAVKVNESVVSPRFYQLPEEVDRTDLDQVRAAVAEMPAEAFGIILAGWVAGAFLGGGVAALIAGRSRCTHAGIVGGWILFGSVFMMVVLPHPKWMIVAALLQPLPVSMLAGKLVSILVDSPSPTPVNPS